jgi:hypothetical protein
MKKQFEEKKLRISVSIAFDPDHCDILFSEIEEDISELFDTYRILYKNIDVELEDIKYE